MFRISTATCGAFTLAEVLIMAALNMENMRLATAGQVSPASRSKRETRGVS